MDSACVLRDAVRAAYMRVLRHGFDLLTVNEALANLSAALAPSLDRLMAAATAHPSGPVAAVLEHVSHASRHAANGLVEPAVVSMISAAAAAVHLSDERADRV